MRYLFVLFLLCLITHSVAQFLDFSQCLQDMIQKATDSGFTSRDQCIPNGLLNNQGECPSSLKEATAMSYRACSQSCSAKTTSDDIWKKTLEQFSAWVLPSLAILCQLPFGSHRAWDDFIAILLTVGCTPLAAFSLVITILNGRWIAKKFKRIRFGAAQDALKCLQSLQQTAVKVAMRDEIFTSLVVHPHNDAFWALLANKLDEQASTWTVPSATGVVWVIAAYLMSVAVSFIQMPDLSAISQGQSLGGAWTSLIAIATGWLIVSPKSSARRNADCIERANEVAWVAPYTATSGNNLVGHLMISQHRHIHAIAVLEDDPEVDVNLLHDQMCSQPIYNYARLHAWRQFASKIHYYYDNADLRARAHMPVHGGHFHTPVPSSVFNPNRVGTVEDVLAYCTDNSDGAADSIPTGKVSDFIVACFAALMLQWCTIGAALITALYTPTTGIGCRSLGYIVYGVLSDITWLLFMLSSWLSDKATKDTEANVEDSIIGHITVVPPSSTSVHTLNYVRPRLSSEASTSRAGKVEHRSRSEGQESSDMSPPLSPNSVASTNDVEMGLLDRRSSLAESGARQIRRRASYRFYSILFRRLAKIVGSCNAIFFVALCLVQLTGGFNSCFCGSNVLMRGFDRAYIVVHTGSSAEVNTMMHGFIASVALSVGCTVCFIGLVWWLWASTSGCWPLKMPVGFYKWLLASTRTSSRNMSPGMNKSV